MIVQQVMMRKEIAYSKVCGYVRGDHFDTVCSSLYPYCLPSLSGMVNNTDMRDLAVTTLDCSGSTRHYQPPPLPLSLHVSVELYVHALNRHYAVLLKFDTLVLAIVSTNSIVSI